jgi:hypothetical protein
MLRIGESLVIHLQLYLFAELRKSNARHKGSYQNPDSKMRFAGGTLKNPTRVNFAPLHLFSKMVVSLFRTAQH